MIILYYRKPEYHKDYFPWIKNANSAQDAIEFMDKLGPEYEFKIFSEITMKKIGKNGGR